MTAKLLFTIGLLSLVVTAFWIVTEPKSPTVDLSAVGLKDAEGRVVIAPSVTRRIKVDPVVRELALTMPEDVAVELSASSVSTSPTNGVSGIVTDTAHSPIAGARVSA